MKFSRLISATAALAVLPLVSCIAFPGSGIVGSGSVTTTERSVGAFTRIVSGGSAEVRVRLGPATRVVVTTDDNLQDVFEAKTSGGELWLGFAPGTMVFRTTKLVVDVYLPALEAAAVSGSGDMELLDAFKGNALSLTVSGSGSIAGGIDYASTKARISGSGSLSLTGRSPSLELVISGSGSFKGRDLASAAASATISGSGGASVNASDRLTVRLSGSGNVRYYGRPQVDSTVSGSGFVKPGA